MSTFGLNNIDENSSQLLQADVLNSMFGFAESLAIKSAVELRIADIIHSYGQPMSLSHIASKMDCSTIDITSLSRVMNLLVRKKFFTIDGSYSQSTVKVLYGLTPKSRLLLNDHEMSLAPMFLTITHPLMVTPWHEISRWIKEGGLPFQKVHKQTIWEMTSKDTQLNKLFNNAFASMSKVTINYILMSYQQGFHKIKGTLVDVGGGIGQAVDAIVNAHPQIKGINFDLPQVVACAPQYHSVIHVAGDMFKEIPNADAILIKAILHNWGDEECVKILKNCRKAVIEKSGKVIIIDMVLQPEGNGLFDDIKVFFDLEMALNLGGKERTEQEWNKLLNEANFTRYNIIEIPLHMSIIEAYP